MYISTLYKKSAQLSGIRKGEKEMRRYTLKENAISALIGITIGIAIIPQVIIEREKVEPVIIDIPEPVYIDFVETSEKANEPEIVIRTEGAVATVENVETENQVSEEEPYFPYTQEDVYLVGNTVFHEVGVLRYRCTEEEAMKALKMTASAIVNRAKMNYKNLGRTIESQVKRSQYASYEKISESKQEGVDEIFYQIAEEILQNGPVVSERLVYQSEFEQGEVVSHIDNQYFGLVPKTEYENYKNAE